MNESKEGTWKAEQRIDDVGEMQQQRPTPKLADPDAAQRGLRQWFAERHSGAENIKITDFSIPENSGMSNITLLFDLAWRDGKGPHQQSYVARLQPTEGKLVFPEYDLSVQYRAMAGVQKQVPVPPLFGLEEDPAVIGTPFYVMEKVEGIVPPDMPPMHMAGWLCDDATPKQREHLWWKGVEAMCKVHEVDWKKAGFDFLNRTERAERALDQQLDYWGHYLRWAPEGIPHPEYERGFQWFLDNKPPPDEDVGLCWGDSRMGNTMFTPDRKEVAAVLDWEMVTLGNRVQDLSYWVLLDQTLSVGMSVPRLEGMPDEDETVNFWARKTGLDSTHYLYYKFFALWRFGLILTRTAICSGSEDPKGGNFVTPMMEKMLSDLGG